MRTSLDVLGQFSITLTADLVPGRQCGECSACCTVLNIDTEEFQKVAGVPCAHLHSSGGCGIHATRFPVCRSYHCGWRYVPGLSEEWRPDKSGILVDFQTEGLPPHYKKRPGIRLTLIGPKESAFKPEFLDHVARLIANDVPVILAVPGPPGHFPASVFLNDPLSDAARKRDIARMKEFFSVLLGGLAGHKFDPVVHRHRARAPVSLAL